MDFQGFNDMDAPRFKSIARSAPDMLWLGFFYFTTSCGHLIWRATVYNFGLEEYNVKPEDISYLFSIAAIPGLLTIGLGFLVQRITLVAILISSYFLIGAGLIIMGESANWQMVWGGVLLLNFGIAVIYPIAGCFCLNRSRADRAAVTLGSLKSLGPAAAFATIPLMTFLLPLFDVRTLLLMAGYVTIAVGMAITPHATRFVVMRQMQRRFQFRRQLLPFYALNFLNGSRSALFKTFVIFFLVHNYGLEIGTTASIVLCGYVFNCAGFLLVGPCVQSFGHRKVLQYVYLSVAFLFLGFSIIEARNILIILYLADSFLFCTSVVTDAHLKLNCTGQDYVGQLSAGVSVFYFAGFIMPGVGAVLWHFFDYHGPFVLGAVLAFISILVSQSLASNPKSVYLSDQR
jgi:hypothetical protein